MLSPKNSTRINKEISVAQHPRHQRSKKLDRDKRNQCCAASASSAFQEVASKKKYRADKTDFQTRIKRKISVAQHPRHPRSKKLRPRKNGTRTKRIFKRG